MIQFDMANSKINIKSYCSPRETVDATKVVEHQVKQSSPPNGGEASKLLVTTIYRTSHSSVQLVTLVYSRTSHSIIYMLLVTTVQHWSQQCQICSHNSVKFVAGVQDQLQQQCRTCYSIRPVKAVSNLLQQYKARNSNIEYLTVYYLLQQYTVITVKVVPPV